VLDADPAAADAARHAAAALVDAACSNSGDRPDHGPP
jgi:hypothetical protein